MSAVLHRHHRETVSDDDAGLTFPLTEKRPMCQKSVGESLSGGKIKKNSLDFRGCRQNSARIRQKSRQITAAGGMEVSQTTNGLLSYTAYVNSLGRDYCLGDVPT